MLLTCPLCGQTCLSRTQQAYDTHLRCSKKHKDMTRLERKREVESLFPPTEHSMLSKHESIHEEKALTRISGIN